MAKERFRKEPFENPSEPQIIVDIGSGSHPLGLDINELEKLKNKIYLALDIDKNALLNNKEFIKRFKVNPKEAYYILARGEKIPLVNESVDEVFLGNFLGIPYLDEKIKLAVLEECFRILKPEGLLKVFEAYTPPEKGELKDKIEKIGFEFYEEKLPTPVRFIDSYFLIFKKPKGENKEN